jgi:hypothetical protein
MQECQLAGNNEKNRVQSLYTLFVDDHSLEIFTQFGGHQLLAL